MLVPVILSGGMGSRLWPLSRRLSPKQFLPLTGDRTLFGDTALRAAGLPSTSPPLIVCNRDHRFLAREALETVGLTASCFILEPVGRNTAPAVATAAYEAIRHDRDALLLVLPADHHIGDPDAFATAVETGTQAAAAGRLVTFGIVPHAPATGFGYIQSAPGESDGDGVLSIAKFIEKPTREAAEKLIATGNCFWNSGMFLLGAATYLEELDRYAPEISRLAGAAIDGAEHVGEDVFLDTKAFEDCPADSIDYAVMERTRLGAVVPLDCDWNDVGSWTALKEILPADAKGNVRRGDTLVHETRNNLVIGRSRLVTVLGVENLVVVETPDAVLVTDMDHAQQVKGMVEALEVENRTEVEHHTRVERPWGFFESLLSGEGYQVKLLGVHPGRKLSLQLHHKRSEHWIVVRGTAEVTCGDTVQTMAVGETIDIPLGAKHRLANLTREPLELIEVQLGSYLGEDDIVRLEDDFGRTTP